ncbi:hypothetical protein KP509_23G052800 [Ceratopteris richardii]|nr:hypothetical protein KP509_23G052800 [Ceratopteris richardii]
MYIYRETLSLGQTELPRSEVEKKLTVLASEWQGSSYDLLSRNCNHFCNDFATELGVEKIPGWVNRFANAGETAFEAAETTMKRLRQAKTEVVSASKVAYRTLFGNVATSVSPDPEPLEGSTSNGGSNLLRLPFLKTPTRLFSKIGFGFGDQSEIVRTQGEESANRKNETVQASSPVASVSRQPPI